MSTSQTYSITDTLTALNTQAGSDTGSVLANADAVSINSGTIESGDFSKLNTIANIADGPITATVQGTGTALTSSTPLSNLGTSDKISFQIVTSATPAQIKTISGYRASDGNYPITFVGSANLTGAYNDFVSSGSDHTNYTTVKSETEGVPIALSTFTTTSAQMISDLNKLFKEAEGVVTVAIEDDVSNYSLLTSATNRLNTANDNGKTHSVTVNTGSQALGSATVGNLNDLAGQSPITSITGTITAFTATAADLLSADLSSSNSTMSFTMAGSGSDGTLTVSQATGLLDHTSATTTGVNVIYTGGISGAVSDCTVAANPSSVMTAVQAVITEDSDAPLTVTNTALTTKTEIAQLNALATASAGVITATVQATGENLLSIGSGGITIGTADTDAITITVTDAISASHWKTLDGKTSSTVTLSGGFSGALSGFADDSDITSNLSSAFGVAANKSQKITVTGTLGAANITALNQLATDTNHTGVVQATLSGALADFSSLGTSASDGDLIAITITDALDSTDIAALNTLKTKTAGVITVNHSTGITATAAQLKTLDTDTSDVVTMTVSGTSNTVEDVLLASAKTSLLTNMSIAGITDAQGKVAGTDLSSDVDTALTNIKTQINSSSPGSVATTTAIDTVYDQVTTSGSVALTGGAAISVDNAQSISGFTVSSNNNAISYTISDDAGSTDGTGGAGIGVATNTTAVNTAIANASSVTATGTLTVAQAVEMLGGVSNSVANSKFTYSIDDSFENVTAANEQSDADHPDKVAHTNATAVTLSAGSVADLITSVSDIADGTHTYTVRDTLDNLSSTSTTNIDLLLKKASSIEIAQSDGTLIQVDADVESNRTKLRQLVTYAADGGTAVKITASITGEGANLLDGSTGLTTSATRGDVITLNVEAPSGGGGYNVADVASLKAKTVSTTITLNGGIADTLGNMTADKDTAHTNLTTAMSATVDAPIALTEFAVESVNDVTRLNTFFGALDSGTVVTGTVKDITGTDRGAGGDYILSTSVATLNPRSNDLITVNLGNVTVGSDDTITELGSLAGKGGVTSITGNVTLNATRAGLVNSNNSITNSNGDINYILSNAIDVDAAAALVAKVSSNGSTDFTNGISDTFDKYVNSSTDATGLSTNFTSVKAADSNAPVAISTTLTSAAHVKALNALAGNYSGAITATVTSTEAILDDITGSLLNTTVTVTDDVSIAEYDIIKATTANAVQFDDTTGMIKDSIDNLYSATGTNKRVTSLNNAIKGDLNMNIQVDGAVTSNFSQVNDIAGGTDGTDTYVGSLTATMTGTASELGVSLSNLSGSGTHADSITYNVSNAATVAELAAMAGNTDQTINDSGIKDNLSNLVETNGTAGTANLTTALGKTTQPAIEVVETIGSDTIITITEAADINEINKLIELANSEGSAVTMSIEDIAGSNLLLSNELTNATGTGSAITVNLGTVAADATTLGAINTLAGKSSVTSLTANVTGITAALIGNFGTTMSNVGSGSKFQIDYTTTAVALSLADAATLAGKTGKANSINYQSGVTITDGTDLSNGSGTASTNFAAVVAKDTDVNLSISNNVDGSADIDGLNTANGSTGTTGTITAAVVASGTNVKALTIGRSGRSKANNNITVQVSDAASFTVAEYQALDDVVKDGNTIDLTTNSAKLVDSLTALDNAKASTVTTAIADGASLVVEVDSGTITSATDLAKLDAIANVVGTGGVKASATATAAVLTNSGAGYSNLSSNDDITFSVTGSASVAQIAMLAADTKDANSIAISVGINDTLSNLMEMNDAGSAAVAKTNYSTALSRTAGEPITVTEGASDTVINITDANATNTVKQINKLIELANAESSAVTMSIQDDSSDNKILTTGTVITGAAAGSSITVALGTVSATDDLLTAIDTLGAQDGISSITADITGMNTARITKIESLTNISSTDSKYQLNFTTSGEITLAKAKALAGKTALNSTSAIDYAANITGTSTQFYDTSSSALHNDLLTVLAKDANAPLEVTDTLTDSSDITILNALEDGDGSNSGTTGGIQAAADLSHTNAKAITLSNKALTIDIQSGSLDLAEIESIQNTSSIAIGLSGTAKVVDSLADLGTKSTVLQALITGDSNAPIELSDGELTTTTQLDALDDALQIVGTGGIKASVTQTSSNITSKLSNASSSDNITYKITSNINVADTNTIVGKTSQSTITLDTGYKLADSLINLMDGSGSLKAAAATAADAFASNPNVVVDTITSGNLTTANITDLNGLVSSDKVANVSANITDTDGTKILAGTHVLSVGDSDEFVVDTGTYAMTGTNRDELIKLGKQAGVTHLSGTITGVTAAHTTELIKVSNAFSSTNVSGLNMTTSEALGVAAAAGLTEKGNITFTGAAGVGITTATITDLVDATSPFAATTNLDAIVADDPDVNISYTGAALTTADHISMINTLYSKNNSGSNTGEITLALNTTAGNLANLASGMASNAKALDINITSAIGNDAFATLDSKTSVALNFTGSGKMEDSLDNFIKSDGTREDGLTNAISQDSDVAITITDTKITSTDFAKLNAVAAGTAGVITATVEGIADDVDSLTNLAAATDDITFVITSSDTNTEERITTIASYTTGATTIDVAKIKDTYDDVKLVLDNTKVNHADAAIVIDSGDFTVTEYNGIVTAGVGSIDFSAATLVGAYSDIIALGKSVIEGQKISITDNIDISKLDTLTGSTYNVTLSDITFNLEDTGSTLASSSNSSKVDAATAIVVSDSTTVSNLQTIATNANLTLNTGITYTGVTDVPATLASTDATVQGILQNKVLTFDGTATADQFRQALTNDGTGSVVGTVTETDSSKLTTAKSDTHGALTGATNITLVLQASDTDLTGITFDETVTDVDFNLNGKTGIIMTVDQADNKTITKGGGTYIIKDDYSAITTAGADDGTTATDPSKYEALYGANEIIVTDFDIDSGDDLSGIRDSNASTVLGSSISTTDMKVTFAATDSLDDTKAAALRTVTKIDLASNVSLTIESDAFDNSSNEWSDLTTITGLGETNNLVISNGFGTSSATIDLYGISTLTNIDAVTIADTTAADVINLSAGLTESGVVTVNLSASDADMDKIYFGVNESSFTSSNTLEYVTVNNFEVAKDRIGLYYYGFSGDSGQIASAVGGTNKRTGVAGGTASLTADRTFIEEDSNVSMAAISSFDTVSNIKTMIGNSVAAYTAVSGSNRLMYAHYNYDETLDKNYAIINAADLTGLSSQTDLASTDSFEVIGVAQLVSVSEGALGDTIGGYNLTASKPSGLGGA